MAGEEADMAEDTVASAGRGRNLGEASHCFVDAATARLFDRMGARLVLVSFIVSIKS